MFMTKTAIRTAYGYKQAKIIVAKNFWNFEEALVRVRWAQAGLIQDLLLNYMADEFLKKMHIADHNDLDYAYENDYIDPDEEEMYYTKKR